MVFAQTSRATIRKFTVPARRIQLKLKLSACFDDVSGWMPANRLQLNTAKTEILWCATSRRRHQLPTSTTRVGNDHVTSSTTVRDLGIYIDSDIMFLERCFPALLCYVSCAASDAPCRTLYFSRWLSLWYCRVWTAAMRRLLAYLHFSN